MKSHSKRHNDSFSTNPEPVPDSCSEISAKKPTLLPAFRNHMKKSILNSVSNPSIFSEGFIKLEMRIRDNPRLLEFANSKVLALESRMKLQTDGVNKISLKKVSIKPSLNTQGSQRCYQGEDVDFLLRFISGSRELVNFSLDLYFKESYIAKLDPLCLSLRNLPYLKELKVKKQWKQIDGDEDVYSFLKAIRKVSKINLIGENFVILKERDSLIFELNEGEFNNICNIILLFKDIKRLSLLCPDQEISSEQINDLDDLILKKLKIQKLKLNLGKISSFTTIKNLFETISNMPHLKKFFSRFGPFLIKSSNNMSDLNFSLKYGRNNEEEFQVIHHIFNKYPSLESVTIDYKQSSQNFDFKLMNQLSIDLNTLGYLRYLDLCFESCQSFSDKSVGELLNLASLIKLEHLFINCNWAQGVSDYILSNISYTLPFLINLTKLRLSFFSCTALTSKGLSEVINSLETHRFLTELVLEFKWVHLIDDSPLVELSNVLKNMGMLKTLHLKFGIDDKHPCFITKLSLSKIVSSLQYLCELQKLHLGFSYAETIDDICLGELGLALNNLLKLKTFEINLDGCSKITSKGLKVLKKGLEILTLLEECSLSFGHNLNIDLHGIKDLLDGAIVHKDLTELKLNFPNCNLKENWKDEISVNQFTEGPSLFRNELILIKEKKV